MQEVSTSLESALKERNSNVKYYYIAHLLDKVIIGDNDDNQWEELEEAYKNSCLLEIHLFNDKKEIFAVRVNGELKEYEQMEHEKEETGRVITRSIKIDKSIAKDKKYTKYKVKEYIDYDKTTHMAYVEKTVLCGLEGEKKK